MFQWWLHYVSIVSLAVGLGCAVVIAIDERHAPQRMWIMNAVRPVAALFGTMPWLWFCRFGRLGSKDAAPAAPRRGDNPATKSKPFAVMVAEATSHCGSGCTMGDICAEWLAFAVPGVAVWFGWQSVLTDKMFAVWILDYVFAYGFGVVFQ